MKDWQFLQADATRLPFADDSVDLILGSPPYIDARLYLENGQNLGISRDLQAWIDFMLEVTTEACRVSRGLVLWVCAGVTRDRIYQPGPEGLLYEWVKRGGVAWRPCYWHRVGIPGSGGKQWLRADIEYVLAFKRNAEWLEFADNTANGHPPKWAPGGEMSHRTSSGARVNQWGHPIGSGGTVVNGDDVTCGPARPSHVELVARDGQGPRLISRRAIGNGERSEEMYIPPAKANPGNIVKVIVGGGVMGHPMSHENEAPYPVALCEWFIRHLVPKGGTVLDPFSGSGTTVDAAWRLGRKGIGTDLRMSQVELGIRRMKNPHAVKSVKKPGKKEEAGLFA